MTRRRLRWLSRRRAVSRHAGSAPRGAAASGEGSPRAGRALEMSRATVRSPGPPARPPGQLRFSADTGLPSAVRGLPTRPLPRRPTGAPRAVAAGTDRSPAQVTRAYPSMRPSARAPLASRGAGPRPPPPPGPAGKGRPHALRGAAAGRLADAALDAASAAGFHRPVVTRAGRARRGARASHAARRDRPGCPWPRAGASRWPRLSPASRDAACRMAEWLIVRPFLLTTPALLKSFAAA